jgi:hypothetical protein
MLDNGYVYLAATRLSLFRSTTDWALVIEVFGFSPRAGVPDLNVSTFASTLTDRKQPTDYVSIEAFENYLRNNPHNTCELLEALDLAGPLVVDKIGMVPVVEHEQLLHGWRNAVEGDHGFHHDDPSARLFGFRGQRASNTTRSI